MRLIRATLPCDDLPAAGYDVIISNSLLHHLHDPAVLWTTLRQVGRPGAAVLVMDLLRPDSPARLAALVETYACDAPEILRRDFANSLAQSERLKRPWEMEIKF